MTALRLSPFPFPTSKARARCEDCDEIFDLSELERRGKIWLCRFCVRWRRLDWMTARVS